jgi:hypothetical protein
MAELRDRMSLAQIAGLQASVTLWSSLTIGRARDLTKDV